MAPGDTSSAAKSVDDPKALKHVGPSTADIIESAPFEAADIVRRTVSYNALLAAGINPGVAAKLRKEYSLVWSFEWLAGADLACRAEHIRGLDREHRDWIADSKPEPRDSDPKPSTAEKAWRDRQAWLDPKDELTRPCRRCGAQLESFQLGDSRAIQCTDCGFVGVPSRS